MAQIFSVFEHRKYRHLLRSYLDHQPRNGYGLMRLWADELGISPVIISQVLGGTRDFSPEQSFALTQLLGFSALETDYFFALVNEERAGTEALKKYWRERTERLRTESAKLANRLTTDQELNEEDRQIFYSSWIYPAIRLMTDIPGFKDASSIAAKLKLPVGTVQRAIDFLLRCGFCVVASDGLAMGPRRTHLPADSPLAQKSHLNWRLRAQQRLDLRTDRDLFYSGPMVVSRELYEQLREELTTLLNQVRTRVVSSPSEQLVCLNVDLFELD